MISWRGKKKGFVFLLAGYAKWCGEMGFTSGFFCVILRVIKGIMQYYNGEEI